MKVISVRSPGGLDNLQVLDREAQGLIVGSRADQQDMVRALEVMPVRPRIDCCLGFDNIADAFRHEEAGRHFGKICLEF